MIMSFFAFDNARKSCNYIHDMVHDNVVYTIDTLIHWPKGDFNDILDE